MAVGFVPALEKIPSFVYSFALCIAAHSFTKKYQGSCIALHQAEGGQLYSTGRAAFIGLIGFVLMMAVFLGLLYLTDQTV